MVDKKVEDKKPIDDLPSPRFDIITGIFDQIDTLLATNDQEHHLSIFEFEILVLMVKKKIDHLGIITALQMNAEETQEKKGNPHVYQ